MEFISKNKVLLILIVFLLNLFDAASTTFFIVEDIGYEVNPLMAWLIEKDILLFWLYKLFAGFVICGVFYFTSHKPITKYGLLLVVFIYGLLALYHIFCMMFYFVFVL